MDPKSIFCKRQYNCPAYLPYKGGAGYSRWGRANVRCEYLDNDRANQFQKYNWVCICIQVPKDKRKVSVVFR